MEKNFKLLIEYDGTAYHGWQRQTNEPTVQAAIEAAIGRMTGAKVVLSGSGRTDAGVHALGQVANFHCVTRLDGSAFFNGLNGLLPDDIVIRKCEHVDPSFHARFNATGKTYRYRILNRPLPAAIGRDYFWHIRKPLDIDAMRRASAVLKGCHDFKAFEGAGSPRSHTDRTVSRIEWIEQGDGFLAFEIEADGFLRFMVRNIVGTLVEVGLAKRPEKDVGQVLSSADRCMAGATAPAKGLFLVSVRY
jgi:tRNA pseudouridine38-40 synthase